jgi:hypothetical protein
MAKPEATGSDEDFDKYLARRRAGRKLSLVVGVLLFVAIAGVPYALMQAGIVSEQVFAIFFVIDLFVLLGIVRAIVTIVQDKVGLRL